MPQESCLAGIFAIVESVERATYGGVTPGECRAVVRVCCEFGIFATEALDLGGEVASAQVWRNNCVDAFRKPFGPVVFDQGGGLCEMGALDVRELEFAGVAEKPVGGELRHGLDFVLGEDGMFGDGFEPVVVGAIVLAKGHPLCVDDNRARPELDAIFAENLGMFMFHPVVHFGDDGWEVEGGGEDAYTEVVVTREVGVVRHGCEKSEQPLERFWLVPVHGFEATGPGVVLIAVYLDSEVGDDAEITWRATEKGVEYLRVATTCDLLDIAIMVDELDGHYMVAKEAEGATKLTKATSLDVAAKMDLDALAVGDEDLVLAHPGVEGAQTPGDTGSHVCFAVWTVEESSIVGPLEGGSQV